MTVPTHVLSLIVACIVDRAGFALAVLPTRRDRRSPAPWRGREPAPVRGAQERHRAGRPPAPGCSPAERRVRLDLRRAASSHIWEAAARLRTGLPAWVRLEVDRHVDGPLAVPRQSRVRRRETGPRHRSDKPP